LDEEKEKRRYDNDWEPDVDYSGLPARCLTNRMVGCCHFGYYFNQYEGRCDSLYTDSDTNPGPDTNFFASRTECEKECQRNNNDPNRKR